ncbi:MAG: DUF3592 domain-containing protein [Planctomycetes bacterium]|nr:DUF3592 domain-containing protein [Planctomycetota bacterium]
MSVFESLKSPRALRTLTIVGVLLALFSAVDLVRERRLLADARELPAVVVDAALESYTTGSGGSGSRSYRPRVSFAYVVDGLERRSSRITPSDRGGSRDWAEKVLREHPVGTKTRCWVPEGEPDQAYLLRETSWKPPAGLGVGLLVALVAGWSWRRRRRAVTVAP